MKSENDNQFIADGIRFLVHRANQVQDEGALLVLAEIYKGTGAELELRALDHQDHKAAMVGARVLKKLKSRIRSLKKR